MQQLRIKANSTRYDKGTNQIQKKTRCHHMRYFRNVHAGRDSRSWPIIFQISVKRYEHKPGTFSIWIQSSNFWRKRFSFSSTSKQGECISLSKSISSCKWNNLTINIHGWLSRLCKHNTGGYNTTIYYLFGKKLVCLQENGYQMTKNF